MKLKYKIAKPTELTSETIINKAVLKIEEKKYSVVNVTDNSVSFDDKYGFKFNNWERARRLISGKFEISNDKNNNIVVFEYYPIALSGFIWVAFICALYIIVGIITQAYYSGVFSLVFLGYLIFKHYNLKRIANEMLTEILT